MKRLLLIALTLTLTASITYAGCGSCCPSNKKHDKADKSSEWIKLFDGKTLKGWTVKSGYATYRIEDGAIVGKTANKSPNTFLTSDKQYSDFELTFDVLLDDNPLNSGVQIRSSGNDKEKYGGHLRGPQVEIEASPGQSGYIYGEGMKTGWLSPEPKSKDKKVNRHSHFKNGKWNSYRILAVGPRIQTWINGKKIADLTHEKAYKAHPTGHIGLQVHSIRKNRGPYQVRWKNIKLRTIKK